MDLYNKRLSRCGQINLSDIAFFSKTATKLDHS